MLLMYPAKGIVSQASNGQADRWYCVKLRIVSGIEKFDIDRVRQSNGPGNIQIATVKLPKYDSRMSGVKSAEESAASTCRSRSRSGAR